jgi:hypothetical protein
MKMEKKNLEELANLYEECVKLVTKYNHMASEVNFHTRIGVMSSSIEVQYEDAVYEAKQEGVEPPSLEEFTKKKLAGHGYFDTYLDCRMPGAKEYGWNPSDLNC